MTRKVVVAALAVAVFAGPALFMAGMLALMVGAASQQPGTAPVVCAAPVGAPVGGLDDTQMRRAGELVAQAQTDGVPPRGMVVAVATALQEAGLRNLASRAVPESLRYPHDGVAAGDHDSVGIMQQRAGWGTVRERMDVRGSAHRFYAALLQVDGWQRMPVTVAAQTVQRSAYPSAYAKWEATATQAVAALTGGAGGGGCDTTVCPPTGLPVEEGLTPDALGVARCVVQEFGVTTLLGVGSRSSNPDSDHPSGRAVDVMIEGWDQGYGQALGDQIAEWARSNAARFGVTYVIWDRRIWSAERGGEGWRPYTHPSGAGDPTSGHEDHVHVSVHGNRGRVDTGGWVNPVGGEYVLSARFGDCGGRWASCHTGLDMATMGVVGVPVRAAGGGTVTAVGSGGAYGLLTKITHPGGVETWYAHQQSTRVRVGDRVAGGTVIGAVGLTGNTTGPHLHFEVRQAGVPVDPEPFLEGRGVNA